ncbi:hypothetical protein B0A53_01798 [Rhodotorula sp. CCFEE 5036]|nr:hypothetical protein B0A53_01798 [Rhodotorula sp. CCFEE 5036]
MASTSGLSRRRGAGGAAGGAGGGATSSSSPLDSSTHSRPTTPSAATAAAGSAHKVAYDARDLGDADEDRKLPRLTLMEEVLLLGLKDKQGYLSFWNDNISYTLRGCIVLELALRHRIAMVRDPNRRRFPLADRYIQVIDEKLTGEVLLDEALKMMKQSEPMSVGTWIDLMSGETWNVMKIGYQLKQVRERLAKGLVDKGVLRTEKRNFLLFDMATHPVSDPTFKDDVLRRTLSLLTSRTAAVPTSNLYGDQVRYRTIRAVAMICSAFAANVLENALVHLGYDQRESAFAKADELLADFSQWPFGAYSQPSSSSNGLSPSMSGTALSSSSASGGGGAIGTTTTGGGASRGARIGTGSSAALAESANLAEIMRLARLEVAGQGPGDEPGNSERQTQRELCLEVVAACIEVFRRMDSLL